MKRQEITVAPEYFYGYINQIPDHIELLDALDQYGANLILKNQETYAQLKDKIYAPGKWSVKQLLQHLIDLERVFAYRALRIARGDKTPMAGFDQDHYVDNARSNDLSIEDIIEEFLAVRKTTILMFQQFNDEELKRCGTASGFDISALALGFIICGHFVHHQKILESRYYPLIEN